MTKEKNGQKENERDAQNNQAQLKRTQGKAKKTAMRILRVIESRLYE